MVGAFGGLPLAMRSLLVAFLAAMLFVSPANAQVRAELVSAGSVPGGSVRVALRLSHAPGWHSFWVNPGIGNATAIKWVLPPGWTAGSIQWPVPRIIRGTDGKPTGHGYEGTVHLPVTLTAPASARPGTTAHIKAHVTWLMCETEVCIPGEADVALGLPIGDAAPVDPQVKAELAAQAMPYQDPAVRIAAARAGTQINLDLTGLVGAGDMREPHFFPLTEMIWHNAEQKFDLRSDGLSLSMPIDTYWEGAKDHLSGVLAYTDSKGRYHGLMIDTPIGTGSAASGTVGAASSSLSATGLPLTLLFAFLGGLILNLMPCVLPVLSLKALALARAGEDGARAARRDGLHYAAGVMTTFAAVGGALLILRSALGGIGWGFQLQNPYAVMFLALLMAGIGFNLVGLIEVGMRAGGLGQGLIERAGRAKSFLTGTLAVIVATPCTAPFMATALGAAMLATAPVALLIFLALGLGMAAPFLLLSLWPPARRILPRPGAWMATLRTLLAFPMFATAIWLLWILGSQRGADAMALGLIAIVALALALWALGQRQQQGRARWSLVALAAIAVIGASAWAIPDAAPKSAAGRDGASSPLYEEQAYTPQALDAALASKRPVFVYFTADWCVTCKLNERVALHTEGTAALFKEKKVRVLVGDWTSQNPNITAILAQYGRAGVPLYLYFPPGASVGDGKILPQLLSPAAIKRGIE